MRIGVLGGAFDPIHLGHLSIAQEAKEKASLSKILFVPTGTPWMKNATEISPARYRLEMAKIAIAGNPYFEVSPLEIEREGISYTVHTLEEIKKEQGAEAEIFLILGMDSIMQISEWKNPEKIKKICTVIAIGRPGSPRSSAIAEERKQWLGDKAIWIEEVSIEIASSEIRRSVGKSENISHLVPKGVEEYIHKTGLYQGKKEKVLAEREG